MDTTAKLEAAQAARAVLAGQLSFDAFIQRFGNSQDVLIQNVVDLLTHEPETDGLFGAGEDHWNQHRRETIAAIEALEPK